MPHDAIVRKQWFSTNKTKQNLKSIQPMTKKIFIIGVIYLTIVLTLFITCTPCVPFTYTYDITGVSAVFKDNQFVEFPDNSTKNIDSVRINCELSGKEYIKESSTAYNNFMSSAYATTTCHDYLDSWKGLVNKIKNIEIVCNKDVWGVKEGFPLDTTMYGVEKYAFLEKQSMDSLIRIYNYQSLALDKDGRGYGRSRFYIYFKRGSGTDFVKFTMKINLLNGETIMGETKSIKLTN